MKKGTVKFYKPKEGFGFICNEESGNDIFFHVTGLSTSISSGTNPILKKGESVTYEEGQGKKGLTAMNISRS